MHYFWGKRYRRILPWCAQTLG